MAAKKVQKLVVPYLTVKGAIEAIAFYKKGLGATEIMRMPAEDKKRLMHAELEFNGHAIYLSDDFSDAAPEMTGGGRSPLALGGSPVAIFVQLEAPKEVDKLMAKAAKAGAKITMQAADQFWGDRFGMIEDPFGHAWSFGAPLPKPKKAAPKKKKPKSK